MENSSKFDSKEMALCYLYNKAVTDQYSAKMSLGLLLDKGIGIGDHSTGDFLNNLDEALDKLVDSSDRLAMVNKLRSGEV